MTQDQKPDFTELALQFVGTASLRDPINVRIESALDALIKAHDLGVERSGKVCRDSVKQNRDLDGYEWLECTKTPYQLEKEIRTLKLGKGE